MVDIYWNLDALLQLISAIAIFIASLIVLWEYRRTKTQPMLLFALCWTFMFFSVFSSFLMVLFLKVIYKQLYFIFQVIWIFFLNIFVDSVSRKSISKVKLYLFATLSTLVLYNTLVDVDISPYIFANGSETLIIVGNLKITSTIFFGTFLGLTFIYFISIYRASPKALKLNALIMVIAVFIMAGLAGILFVFGINRIIPAIDLLLQGLGSLIWVVAFIKTPKLAYIKPFRAYELMIFYSNNGLLIFSKTWNKIRRDINSDPALFSGFLFGMDKALQDVLQKGDISEINMKNLNLTFKHSDNFPIVFLITSDNPSPSLRNALNIFEKKFIEKYSGKFREFSIPNDFSDAKELIDFCFPFVVKYE